MTGGTKAVNITQKQQMFIIFFGLFFVFFILIDKYPEELTVSKFLDYSRSSEKFKILDFSIDPNNRYTFWSGITGGLFLALSYFGTDQSQVQRYISGKSIKEIRLGLVFNGIFKIPMQFFILLLGVMVFVFFEFNKSPVNYNPQVISYMEKNYSSEYDELTKEYDKITKDKHNIQGKFLSNTIDFPAELNAIQIKEKEIRTKVKEIVSNEDNTIEENDKDYVFLHFILNYLPRGLIGLLIAVIICAAMSSTASELNALAATTTIDLYKRNHVNKKSDKHYLNATKLFTVIWGIIAIIFASFGTLFENLIQLVNIIGSIFYGTILGIFLVAFFFKKIKSNSVFYSACISQAVIFTIFFTTDISYLWLNFIGASLTVLLSNLLKKLN
jgi:Na+/proline symporter